MKYLLFTELCELVHFGELTEEEAETIAEAILED